MLGPTDFPLPTGRHSACAANRPGKAGGVVFIRIDSRVQRFLTAVRRRRRLLARPPPLRVIRVRSYLIPALAPRGYQSPLFIPSVPCASWHTCIRRFGIQDGASCVIRKEIGSDRSWQVWPGGI